MRKKVNLLFEAHRAIDFKGIMHVSVKKIVLSVTLYTNMRMHVKWFVLLLLKNS